LLPSSEIIVTPAVGAAATGAPPNNAPKSPIKSPAPPDADPNVAVGEAAGAPLKRSDNPPNAFSGVWRNSWYNQSEKSPTRGTQEAYVMGSHAC
jgi:hypothetical protein